MLKLLAEATASLTISTVGLFFVADLLSQDEEDFEFRFACFVGGALIGTAVLLLFFRWEPTDAR